MNAMSSKPAAPPAVTAPAAEPPERGRLRRAMAYGPEAVGSLGLALVFFGIFLALLNVFFPTGIKLRELVVPRPPRSEPAGTAVLAEVGRLAVLKNDVRSKPSGAIAWGAASDNLTLHDRDAIQTLSSGRGLVVFEDGGQVHLERNSLMIVMAKAVESEASTATRAGVILVDGEIWGRMRLDPHEKMNVRLPGGDLELKGGSHAGAEFRIAVTRDKSSTVTLYKGEASVTSKGQSVQLTANQGTRISATGELGSSHDLAAAPRLLGPAEGTELTYGDFPPQILFHWAPVAGATRYRLVVARDRDLKDVVIDQTVERSDLLIPGLKGQYVWRVTSVRDDMEGAPSPWSTVRTRPLGGPPALTVEEIPKVLETGTWRLRGRTRPGSKVMVSGEPATVARDGSFELAVTLEPGANVITVEAIDAEGNASYWTRVVHVKS